MRKKMVNDIYSIIFIKIFKNTQYNIYLIFNNVCRKSIRTQMETRHMKLKKVLLFGEKTKGMYLGRFKSVISTFF